MRYGNHQKTTLYPTHHKLKLQERARIEGYLENRPYINPKIAKLGPTLVPKINCQGPKAFKMAPKSKKSKWQKQILQKKKHLFIRVKPRKLFRPVLNSKHSPIEPKKAKNDPKSKKSKSQKIFYKKKLSLYKSKASKAFQTPSQLQTQPGTAQKGSK